MTIIFTIKSYIKVLMIISASILMSSNINAQDQSVLVGLRGGVDVANFGGSIKNNKGKVGFSAGITLDLAFTETMYLMTGVDFTSKGMRSKSHNITTEDGSTFYVKNSYNPMYLQLPVHFGYKMLLGRDSAIFFRGGPYVAYGITGNYTTKGDGYKESQKVFSSGGLKKFDLGVGLAVGTEIGRWGFELGNDFGFLNVSEISGSTIRNNNFYFSIIYKFKYL